jgi:RNA polymerase sigma factor (sigma-70 family)
MRRSRSDGARLAELEELYRRRYRAFLRFALALLGERELARDAVQETFARAVRGRAGFRHESSLEAWLYRMLTNHCRDLLRSAARDRRAQADLYRQNGTEEDRPELRAAIAALPERQRLAVFLRHYADLEYEAIASVLGIRRGTVAATLHTAHAALRQTLKEEAR